MNEKRIVTSKELVRQESSGVPVGNLRLCIFGRAGGCVCEEHGLLMRRS
jgi:hypothetical protein